MRNCLENQTLLLPLDVVTANNLPCQEVSMKHIETIVNIQETMELKLVPGLTNKNIHPGQYAKMRVKNSTKVFGHTAASAMHDLADSGIIDDNAHTTAWFCDKTNNWFDMMSNRQYKRALSSMAFVLDERIVQLQFYLDLISRMKVYGTRGIGDAWKP
jgi:hypothetical protein